MSEAGNAGTLLRMGQRLMTGTSQLPCEVEGLLGSGGQGEVYRAQLAGRAVALKWYLPHSATIEQRQIIESLVRTGPPDRRFLWPEELVTAESFGSAGGAGDPGSAAGAVGPTGFGYIMPLREERYRSIVHLMKRRVEPTFRALITAGLGLADSYLQLHSKGLCYRDISFGNVFFDPENGDVLICDNDNVGVDGQVRAGVLGTPRFMAPEVVRGEALPSTQTDLYSLSVLLFYLLLVHHPLEGAREAAIRCLDLPAMTHLYGTDPLFIFDPHNDSNRPVAGLHDNALAFWPLYPQFLRDLFTRAFTEGISDPLQGRVRESEWRAALARVRDSLLECAGCGAENFYDARTYQTTGHSGRCWACDTPIVPPARIRVGRHVVMLTPQSALYPHHLDEHRLYDFARPAATVSRHPTDPTVLGLTNLSDEKWVVLSVGGATEVPPGRSVRLASGLRIQFGRAEGEVRV